MDTSTIENARWTGSERSTFVATIDGVQTWCPADRADLWGVEPAAYAPTLAETRSAALANLEGALAAKVAEGVVIHGATFAISDQAQNMMMAVRLAMATATPGAFDGDWRDAWGVNRTLTEAEFVALTEAAYARRKALGDVYAAKVEAVLLAADVAALDAMDLGAGWPA